MLDLRNKDLVKAAIENLSKTHALVHVHGNNYGRTDFGGFLVTPDFLEVTFINRERAKLKKSDRFMLDEWDQPCHFELPEIIIGKWNVD